MGYKGQTSEPVTFRIAGGLLDEMDSEINVYKKQTSRSEFINDAIKFYLNYLKNQRIEDRREKSVVVETRN